MGAVFTGTRTLTGHYTSKADVSLPTSPETMNCLQTLRTERACEALPLIPPQQEAFVFRLNVYLSEGLCAEKPVPAPQPKAKKEMGSKACGEQGLSCR